MNDSSLKARGIRLHGQNSNERRWAGWVLFPELPREHREVRFSGVRAAGLKLAAVQAIEIAMERVLLICLRCPTRVVIMIERVPSKVRTENAVAKTVVLNSKAHSRRKEA